MRAGPTGRCRAARRSSRSPRRASARRCSSRRAATVRQALDIIDGEQPDLALLDVDLRGERATRVAAALQARDMPFVLITGYSGAHLTEPELRDAPRIDEPISCRALARAVECAFDGAERSPG